MDVLTISLAGLSFLLAGWVGYLCHRCYRLNQTIASTAYAGLQILDALKQQILENKRLHSEIQHLQRPDPTHVIQGGPN